MVERDGPPGGEPTVGMSQLTDADVLRAAVASAPTAPLMVDADGRIVLANIECERLFGYGRDALLGRHVEILVPERGRDLHPAYRTGYFVDPTTRSMGGGRDLFARRRDGTEFPVEIGSIRSRRRTARTY